MCFDFSLRFYWWEIIVFSNILRFLVLYSSIFLHISVFSIMKFKLQFHHHRLHLSYNENCSFYELTNSIPWNITSKNGWITEYCLEWNDLQLYILLWKNFQLKCVISFSSYFVRYQTLTGFWFLDYILPVCVEICILPTLLRISFENTQLV